MSTRSRKTPAHGQELGYPRDKLQQGFRKVESSLAVQLRTEKAGFAAFLHARRVPDMISPACSAAGDARIRSTLSYFAQITPVIVAVYIKPQGQTGTRKLRRPERPSGSGRWVMSEGLLLQFSLAKVQIDRVEGRVLNTGDGVGDGDNEDEASEQD